MVLVLCILSEEALYTKSHENIFDHFKLSSRVDTILKLIISKGHYSAKKKLQKELRFLFFIRKYSSQYLSYRVDIIFFRKISKGHNSVKM